MSQVNTIDGNVLQIRDIVENIELLEDNIRIEAPAGLLFGGIFDKQTTPDVFYGERYRITFKNDLDPSKQWFIVVGDLVEYNEFTSMVFKNQYTNNPLHGFEKGDMIQNIHTLFEMNNSFNVFLKTNYKKEIEVLEFGYGSIGQYVSNEIKELLEIKTDKENRTIEFICPYLTYFTCDFKSNYIVMQQGAGLSFRPIFTRDIIKSKKAFTLYKYNSTITSTISSDVVTNNFLNHVGEFKEILPDLSEGETLGWYFPERKNIKAPIEFIKENIDFQSYEETKEPKNRYIYGMNIPYDRDITIQDRTFKYSDNAHSQFNLKQGNTLLNHDGQVLQFCIDIVYNYNGPYMDYLDESVVLKSPWEDIITSKDTLELAFYLYPYHPGNLKKYMKVQSVDLFQKDGGNTAGDVNLKYKNGTFARIKFTYDTSKLNIQEGSNAYITFYFPKLFEIGRVSQNQYTHPSAEHYGKRLDLGSKIFTFTQPGYASSVYDETLEAVGVNQDYCVSIVYNTLSTKPEVVNCEDWSYNESRKLFTVTCIVPLLSFNIFDKIGIDGTGNTYADIQCLEQLYKQTLYCLVINHSNNLWSNGIIPPYVMQSKEAIIPPGLTIKNYAYYINMFQNVYKSTPNTELLLEIYSSEGFDEFTYYNSIAGYEQYIFLNNVNVFANIPGQLWNFRGIPLNTVELTNLNKSIVLRLPTLCFGQYTEQALPPVPEVPEGFCDIATINECLIEPDDSVEYKSFTEVYCELDVNNWVFRIESFIKRIPLQSMNNSVIIQMLSLVPGFGTTWI